jgi:phosphatidylserine decarboxylase
MARALGALLADEPAFGAAREGAPLVAVAAAVALLAAGNRPSAGYSRRAGRRGTGIPGTRVGRFGGAALAAWGAWFFRDPVRRCPGDPATLYAAADGRILVVDQVESDWFVRGPALRIATFLSPLDVHVNRSPAAGRLVAYRREPGSFAPAFLAGRSGQNARQLLGIEIGGHGAAAGRPAGGAQRDRLVVTQIAGLVARRIVSWRLPGDALAAGQKLGMIRFGSRTDVTLPAGLAEPLVAPGDRVQAGLTPIARYIGAAIPGTWPAMAEQVR